MEALLSAAMDAARAAGEVIRAGARDRGSLAIERTLSNPCGLRCTAPQTY
jgi:hypothetical protein